MTNVNRPNGDGGTVNGSGISDGNTHMKSTLLNVNNKSLSFADVVAYNYRLDYNSQFNADAATGNTAGAKGFGSTNTTGLKLAKAGIDVVGYKFGWVAEMAQQKNFANNGSSYNARYTNINANVGGSLGNIKLGQEVLGSDNGASVQTPLSTLFAFNGWADKFLVTPTTGLKDSYIKGRSDAMGIVYGADYHQFKSDAGNVGLGRELDLIAEKQLDKNFMVGARAARYKADSASVSNTAAANVNAGGIALTDTNKMWLYGSFKF